MTSPPDDTTADTSAIITTLRAERDSALSEKAALAEALATRNSEFGERIEQQSATIDVLKVMAASPGDPQPVFDLIVDRARDLCDAYGATVFEFDGTGIHWRAATGVSDDPAVRAAYEAQFPMVPTRGWAFGRAILDRRIIRIDDMEAEPGLDPTLRGITAKSNVTIPIMRGDEVIGAIGMGSREKGGFSDSQVELLKTFAEQAVIAITSAETYRALQTRTSDLQETLEYQTATSDLLKVISRSTFDLQPVLATVAETAARLCDADQAAIYRREGESARLVANFGFPPEYETYTRALGAFPIDPKAVAVGQRTLVEGRPVHVHDVAAVPGYWEIAITLGKQRTSLGVPLLREGETIGNIMLARQRVEPFTDRQIQLVSTFADQAVIAIENTRLLTEQKEALEQQTATAEVLQVINSSPGELAPVFDTILEKAIRLCDARRGQLATFDGEYFRFVAVHGDAGFSEAQFTQGAVRPEIGVTWARIVAGEQVVHMVDVVDTDLYRAGHEGARRFVDVGGGRTLLTVALRKDDLLLGALTVYRQEVRAFTDKHIELLRSFAAQAVIAMENARLLTEQQEALEQQTATAEVLQVINSSPGDLAPVFEAVLDKATNLCDAAFGILWTYEDERFYPVALHRVPEAFGNFLREDGANGIVAVASNAGLGAMLRGETFEHRLDASAGELYRSRRSPRNIAFVELGGARTGLIVPLRKDGVLLGAIRLFRQEVRPFTDKQIALLQNFAAQAVIAMENARLITEQREALEQQTATAEVLQVINASPGNLTPVFEAILEKAHDLCDIAHGDLQLYDGEYLHSVAQRGLSAEFADRLRQGYRASDSPASRPLLAGDRFTHIADAAAVGFMVFRSSVRPDGIRTVLFVPLRKDGSLLGMITSARREVRPFTEKEIALLENFAAQAVIAMENARLLTELQQRTEELARRNSEYGERIDQQSATIGVLEAMSASSGDAQPVFQMIVDRARAFCNADNANLALVDGDMLHVQATTIIYSSDNALFMAQFPRPVDATSMLGRAILARDAVQTPDVWVDPQHFLSGGAMPRPRGFVAVPLLRAGAPVGAIVLARNTPGEFSATQVELLRTFAEQAVIAISSADTFKELQRRTADLTRSVAELQALEEVLRAVNSSLELETVLSTIISRAVQLSDADEGTIYEYDVSEQVFVPKSAFGMSAERVAALRERRIKLGQTHLGRSAILRAPVYIEDVQQDPSVPNAGDVLPGIHAVLAVPLLRNDTVIGGLVIRRRTEKGFAKTIITLMQTFSGQAVLAIENARLFQEAGLARTAAEAALVDLRRAQDRLVQAEKMASLGQLTAGIAHEIKNPLNFVNNFSALSTELIDELRDVLAPEPLGETVRTEVDDLTALLKGNLEKVVQHGQRADGIVRSMLDHSRGSSGERRMVDLNALIDEALNLAYHGARAQDQSFNITLERDFGEGIAPIEVNPQDITRVFLNLFANGFYAVTRRACDVGDAGFDPTLKVTTRDAGEAVEIRVRDNGTGIPADIRDKLFQPFFTTKPTGEGTGLGLSITYDIVTQQHGGNIAVDSKVGEYSEFTIRLPRNP